MEDPYKSDHKIQKEENQKLIQMDPSKSVLDLSQLFDKKEGVRCGYCGSKDKTSFRVGFERLIEKGFIKHGSTSVEKECNEKSCCHILNSRVDITEFKISKQQKKHMKRFNQYMNGQRELKIEHDSYKLRNDKQMIICLIIRNIFEKDIANIEIWVRKSFIDALNSDDQQISSALTEDLKGMLKLRIKIDFSEEIYNLESFTEQEEVQLVMTCNLKALLAKHKLDNDFMSAFFPVFMSNLREDQDLCELYEITEDEQTKSQCESTRTFLRGILAKPKYRPNKFGEKRYKPTGEEAEISIQAGESRDYTEFFKEFCPNPVPKEERKHHYTVSLHPAMFTDESFEIYKLFHEDIFDEDCFSASYEKFICSPSLFDPKDPREIKTFRDSININGDSQFVDSGVYPEFFGSYHLYHRIDGVLFAVSIIDILPHNLTSIYCMYHPSYKFLSPGHFTAIREVEYMLMIREKFNQNMRYYSQTDYVVGCPKTEYKQNMKPTYLKCQASLDWVLLTQKIKEKIASKEYHTLDESSVPVEVPDIGKFWEFFNQSLVHTQDGVVPLKSVSKDMLGPLVEIFKEIGPEISEMFCLEIK
ncbi:unnamed protein product [Moneuplotes crassus]|uniref:Arginyl-tRNA--protein transferase 1 n=1 Tax=Euplotes crassus TaxID=5936 RepID=A0AAD1U475_EUPCR|nr:unnamed protein product [Moneuplotes crassus]